MNINGHNLKFKKQMTKNAEIWVCINCNTEHFIFEGKYSKWNRKYTCDEIIIKNIIE